MPHDVLRRALADAKLTPAGLAARISVDAQTVARWLADESRTPQPRIRWAVASELGVDEMSLWPAAARAAVKTGPDREVNAVFPTRSGIPRTQWQALTAAAETDLTFAGYTNYFLWLEVPGLAAVLREKAQSGVPVRFLVGDPTSEVTRRREETEGSPLALSARIAVTLAELEKLRDVGVLARYSDYMGMSVFRFDSDMIVSGGPVQAMGHDAPALHLRKRQRDGIFDAYAAHLDALWEAARPVWPSSG